MHTSTTTTTEFVNHTFIKTISLSTFLFYLKFALTVCFTSQYLAGSELAVVFGLDLGELLVHLFELGEPLVRLLALHVLKFLFGGLAGGSKRSVSFQRCLFRG